MGREEGIEKKLAICIPNYNRPEKLERLLRVSAEQISVGGLSDAVEICISDDCSTDKPQPVIQAIVGEYPSVDIRFRVNDENMGMDHNFLNCVLMSDAEYCWIIGNDDVPEPYALQRALQYLDNSDNLIDFLLCPFDCYDDYGVFRYSVCPIRQEGNEVLYFHTAKTEEYDDLLNHVQNGNGLFCFLSNVIFRRDAWIRHGDMFQDKMDSIFIQMYMNLQTLQEGALYVYTSEKLIRNHSDASVSATFQRLYDILMGLNGVVEYFFQGKWHRKIQSIVVDPYINGRMWDIPYDSPMKHPLLEINSPKADIYNRYFIRSTDRSTYFSNRNVLVYGAGKWGHRVVAELGDYNVAGIWVYDADERKWGGKIEDVVIECPENLYTEYVKSTESVVIVANAADMVQIIEMLCRKGIERIAIII